jgi:hypothetical protein
MKHFILGKNLRYMHPAHRVSELRTQGVHLGARRANTDVIRVEAINFHNLVVVIAYSQDKGISVDVQG